MKVRQDAWSHEDDLLLAETVLRYIREGGTQLAAFEEVGDKLNRTSAACGFRWNAEVRGKYDQAIAIAKKQRKERKRAMDGNKRQTTKQEVSSVKGEYISSSFQDNFSDEKAEERVWFEELNNRSSQNYVQEYSAELLPAPVKGITLDDCISFLSDLKKEDRSSYQMTTENERLRQENSELQQKNRELEKQLKKLTEQQDMIQEDYQALVQIMDRARRMVLFEDHEDRKAPTFRMDKNGNLEVAK